MVTLFRIPFLILLLLFLGQHSVLSTTVTAKFDRNPIAVDESVSFQLIIDAPSKGEPDFSPLEKHFDILGQSSSTNMQIINGKRSQSKTHQLQLMPKRIGRITVEPITVGNERSNPLELIVTSNAPQNNNNKKEQDFFLEMSASTNRSYVQAQIIITVRLFIGTSLTSASLSEPSPADAAIHKLGDDTEHTTTRGNRHYRVVERRYALFPQKAGPLTIEPVLFQGQMGRRSNSFFDPFSQGGVTKRVRSSKLEITILPKPENAVTPWLPSEKVTGELAISNSAGEVHTGEPLTITITLEAEGLQARKLPEPTLPQLENMRVYPDQPQFKDHVTAKGIVGTMTKKIALAASKPGQYRIPPMTITWWNTLTDTLEKTDIGPQEFTILPPLNSGIVKDPSIEQTKAAPPSVVAPQKDAPVSFWQYRGLWFWLCSAFFILWLLTILLLVKTKKQATNFKSEEPTSVSKYSLAEKNFKNYCLNNQPEKAKATLALLLQNTNGRTLSIQHNQSFDEEQKILNEYLYSPTIDEQAKWSGKALWHAWLQLQKTSQALNAPQDTLQPLYKNNIS